MEGFVEIEVHENSLCLEDEVDVKYEFDAPMFFDFTKDESLLDDCEAEQWFEFATSYPPSPFVSNFKWGNGSEIENANGCVDPQQVSAMDDENNRGVKNSYKKSQDALDDKVKTLSRSSSSKSKVYTFMKPTASHLAKLKNLPEVQTSQSLRRNQEKSSLSIDGQLLTKRQKLEAGFLRKVAHLKHQTLLTHKTKEVDGADVNLASKPNTTIPREPNLQTALRAQRHKSRTNTESVKHTKSGLQVPKARSLTKKGGGALNTSSISNSETRTNSKQEKCRMINKLRASTDDKKLTNKGERGVFRNIKVFPLEENDKTFQDEPPTELLSKLTLTSEAKQTAKSQPKEKSISKSLKENRRGSSRQEHEMMNLVKEEIQRLYGKQYQCSQEMGSLVTMQTCKLELGH
ncbi:unnamed protein product [Lathyrus oleraceus]|uniref:TPX2 central domain-containing protein n=2 Tax=Pisum sativum TaxID=3888 RepID=A0A9D5BJS5_PEA|nr:uncharacterized protein LOC127130849 isoform X1 [Pisum sativum]KAI5444762.1 hypothetical protein KIW84_013151 [Pisum sativum]